MRDYDFWICPYCHNSLNEELTCSECKFTGEVKNGLVYLHKTDQSWDKCEKEICGWINVMKELGIYTDNEDHYYLPDGKPHLAEFYREAKRHIDQMLSVEEFDNKICLDLGAGIGWVENYILKKFKDAKLIALECNDDTLIGLGRSAKLKEHFGCDYVSMIGDMHNIPIRNDSVDIVYTVDALHHFSDLSEVFNEVYRVLKRGGHFLAVNEPYRPSDGIDESSYLEKFNLIELRHGVIERRPTIEEYIDKGGPLSLRVLNKEIGFCSPGLILYGEKM